MKKAVLREYLKNRETNNNVKVIGAEKPVILPYDPETKITIDDDGNIKEILPKRKKTKKGE
jgi:flagellar basal body rod protein FlgF